MRRSMWGPGIGALALLLTSAAAGSAQAQQQGPAQEVPQGAATGVQLIYEREVFAYSDRGRRDPFHPLTDDDESGPRFEELALQGVIYSTGQGRSVALIGDASGRVYRVRVGDVLGNSRVVEIGPLRVVLAVENFGTIRQEMLELKKRGGADR